MNQVRFRWLVGIMVVLVVLRASDWRHADHPDPVSEAVVRVKHSTATNESQAEISTQRPNAKAQRELDESEPRNAFAIRMPPAPPAPPKLVAVVPPKVKPFVGPMPAPPPPPPVVAPPPPFQIIGTWEDDQGVSVFLSGPRSTLQARVGDVLLNEYRVLRIRRQELVLRRLTSAEEVLLAVPMSSPAAVAIRP